jgi:hypothetical protein
LPEPNWAEWTFRYGVKYPFIERGADSVLALLSHFANEGWEVGRCGAGGRPGAGPDDSNARAAQALGPRLRARRPNWTRSVAGPGALLACLACLRVIGTASIL